MANKKLPKFGTFNIPKDREVPFGAVTPAPVHTQDLFMTGNWRVVRPVIDHEKCTRCLTCYLSCPDSCWVYNEKDDVLEWISKFLQRLSNLHPRVPGGCDYCRTGTRF